MLSYRIITALVALPGFLIVGYLGGVYLKALTALMALIGFYELYRMFLTKELKLYVPLAYVLLLLGFFDLVSREILPYFFFIATGIYYLVQHQKHSVLEFFYTYTSLMYVFLFIFIYEIRSTPLGFRLFLFYFLLIWANDTFAYFVGKKFGRRKIAPALSPKKSVEGALGGLLGALFIAFLYGRFVLGSLTLLPLAFVTALIAQAGDFLESAIKRFAGVKDSGEILPGHGGILDRFDGVLLSAPVFYYLYLLFN
ncbi:phosphatidate cytidylyltransferase [Carboxydothermus hydrogenoformans]|uniref:Phosphatidate cytidylyltransferase n=1 Tax=Carboxydothermus hydrogenoformans (strain ATCC BAA-161 / DSM 6008 / Z-2901) TaxID=246194 RepID=Q3AB84_CARHZ|nr:phosphatidate cytidylyltransferase [Carboxydothermus hydrogenoformans]ABB14294.1 phosphatidate cytidylyltransferase [Carboxydothermus hydrogenoformans Z-2901]